MTANIAKVMNATNEYFAVLCERVKGAEVAAETVKAPFEGKYRPNMLVRVHGAFTGNYGDFHAGEVYCVVSFDGETLTLDKPLHTVAPWLFIATLEPTGEFLSLCDQVAAWSEKNDGSRGLASESIDGYSYSKATDPNGKSGFEAAFSDELARYRKPNPTTLYYARNARPWSVMG
jgi:hypothetical protein